MPRSGSQPKKIPNGYYFIKNTRSGAFAAVRKADNYSDIIAQLPGMGLQGGDVVSPRTSLPLVQT